MLGILKPRVSFRLSRGDPRYLLRRSTEGEKHLLVLHQPSVLRLGRADAGVPDGVQHLLQLPRRLPRGQVPLRPEEKEALPDTHLRARHRHSRRVQVHGSDRRHGKSAALPQYPDGADKPAYRHQLLHLPDHELRHRRLPQRRARIAQLHQLRNLRRAVSAAYRGSHRPLPRRRLPA